LFLPETVNVLLVAGLKVARLVEDVVGGEEHLGLFEDDATFRNESGFIGDGLPCPVVIRIHAAGVANDGRERHLLGDVLQSFMIAANERGPLQKIQRKISADAEFGEDGEIGAAALGYAGQLKNLRGIAFEITDGGIELSEGDLHLDEELG
jgi:hypothetical protein